MTFIQMALAAKYKRIKITQKVGTDAVGFASGLKLFVMQKDDIVLFTKDPTVKGFTLLKTSKVYITSGREVVQLPMTWYDQFMGDSPYVKVNYTKLGVFVKPYKPGEFNECIHTD